MHPTQSFLHRCANYFKHHLPDTHYVKRIQVPIITFLKIFLPDTHCVRWCTSTCYNPYQFVFQFIFEPLIGGDNSVLPDKRVYMAHSADVISV